MSELKRLRLPRSWQEDEYGHDELPFESAAPQVNRLLFLGGFLGGSPSRQVTYGVFGRREVPSLRSTCT